MEERLREAVFDYLRDNLAVGVQIFPDGETNGPEVSVWLKLRDPSTGKWVVIDTDTAHY